MCKKTNIFIICYLFHKQFFSKEGKTLSAHEELQVYRSAIHEVQKTDPSFTFKIICQGLKMWDLDQIDNYLKHVIKLKKRYPDLIVGFDLVQVRKRKKIKFIVAKKKNVINDFRKKINLIQWNISVKS